MTTVSFAGGEDVSFIQRNSATVSTVSSIFRAAFVRCALTSNGLTAQIPPTTASYWQSLSFTALSAFWFHARISNNQSNTTVANCPWVAWGDAGGVWRLLLIGTGVAGQFAIAKRNAAGTLTTLATSAAGAITATNPPMALDVNVNYSTTGRVTVYIDGQIVCDTGASVDVTTDGATAIGPFFLNNHGTGNSNFWSEIILQDTTTLGLALQTLPPVAAGNTQSWTPNTVGNVNPITINDTNFVSTASVNALSEWTLSTTLPAGGWTIEAIVQAARVAAGTTGPQNYEFLTRTVDGSDHVQGTTAPLVGSFSNAMSIWGVNPHTGTAWGANELINSGIESLT